MDVLLKKKLAFFTVISIFCIIPCLYLLDVSYSDRITDEGIEKTKPIVEHIYSLLNNYRDAVRATDSLNVIKEAVTTPERKIAIQSGLDTLRAYLDAISFFVVNNKGILVAGSGAATIGHDLTYRPYYQQAIQGNTFIYPAIGQNTPTPRLFFSSPLSTESTEGYQGIVAFSIDMDRIILVLKHTNYDGICGLITQEGVIFACTREDFLYKSVLPISDEIKREIVNSSEFRV